MSLNTQHQHRLLPSSFPSLLPIYLANFSSSYSFPIRDIHPYNQRVNRPCRKRDYYLDNWKINCKMRRFTPPASKVMVILITYLLSSMPTHKRQHRAFVVDEGRDNAPLITPALFCKVRWSRIRSGASPGIDNLCLFPATMRDMCIMCNIQSELLYA